MVNAMTDPDTIRENVQRMLAHLPEGVELVAAAKTRTPAEVIAAIGAGVRHVGHNYVQEAADCIESVGRNSCCWHMIGHLQRNKAKKATELFDLVETVDSTRLADALERACEAKGMVMPVLIEINSGREPQKAGILPEELDTLVEHVLSLPHLRIEGLMTMGPFGAGEDELRRCFRTTRLLFEQLQRQLDNGPRILSMGMS
ncbi:MAG: YggS family pyridoxal phosphate-dependent enzyme, partial [Deltaproteobacteria bacterium]